MSSFKPVLPAVPVRGARVGLDRSRSCRAQFTKEDDNKVNNPAKWRNRRNVSTLPKQDKSSSSGSERIRQSKYRSCDGHGIFYNIWAHVQAVRHEKNPLWPACRTRIKAAFHMLADYDLNTRRTDLRIYMPRAVPLVVTSWLCISLQSESFLSLPTIN